MRSACFCFACGQHRKGGSTRKACRLFEKTAKIHPKKTKTGPPHPAGRSVVQPDFITLDQRGLVQQKTLLAGGEAAVTRQKLALVIDGGGLVPQQIVNAHAKIIRDPPQRVIVRLTDALCVVAQRGRTKAQLGCKVFELDFLAIN